MRRNGKTTRLIDDAIQALFAWEEIIVPDRGVTDIDYVKVFRGKKDEITIFIDEDADRHNMAQEMFRNKLLTRLSIEHEGCFVVYKDVIKLVK